MTSRREPDVSVVMPVRHAHAHVDDAIRSILAQRLSPLELLVIDDHADRATRARLAAWRRADSRVRLVDVRGSGLVDALNTGLADARGPLVARMDADDVAHPDRLLLQRAFWRTRSNLTVVSCYVESFPRSELGEGYRIYERWLNALREPDEIAREIFVESPLAHPSVLFDRRAVIAAGGYRDDGGPEDYELWLRLHAAGHRFAKVRSVLHYWRDHSSRLSRVDARYARDRFIDTKARYLAVALGERRTFVWGAGRIGRRLARHLLARDVRIEAFVDVDPRKIGRRAHGRPVLAPDALPAAGDGAIVLAAVGSRHARALIRTRLRRAGYVEGRSFWAVA
jgi:glycosyltransferase involved in cell wall biosynthesis